jgi:hypothetical protein
LGLCPPSQGAPVSHHIAHESQKRSLFGVLWLWHVRIPTVKQLVHLVQIRHPVRRYSRPARVYTVNNAAPCAPPRAADHAHLSASRSRKRPRDQTASLGTRCEAPVAVAVAVVAQTEDAAHLALRLVGTAAVVPAFAQQVAAAKRQVSAAAAAVAAAEARANARAPALKCLVLQLMPLREQVRATRCLPAHLGMLMTLRAVVHGQ